MAVNPTNSSYGAAPDVKFAFPQNDKATVSAEKRKLMNISEVFRTQFSSNFDDIQPIIITDISFEIFDKIMKFIYTNQINITPSNYQEIFYASSKYFINAIITEVIQFALTFITKANVVNAYEFFDKYEIQMIYDHMNKICIKIPMDVIAKLNGSNCIHMKILEKILQSPTTYCTEYELYEATVKMLENSISGNVPDVAAEMRKNLGKLKYLIRFPTMTINELARCGKAPSLLTLEEFRDLLVFSEMGLYKESVKFFSSKPRINLKNLAEYIKCPKCTSGREYCNYCDGNGAAVNKSIMDLIHG